LRGASVYKPAAPAARIRGSGKPKLTRRAQRSPRKEVRLTSLNETLSPQAREAEAGSFSRASPARFSKRNGNAKPARAARRAPQPAEKQDAQNQPANQQTPEPVKRAARETTGERAHNLKRARYHPHLSTARAR